MRSMIRLDRIRNGYTRESLGVINIANKMRENRLRRLEHVEKRNNDELVKKISKIRVVRNPGKGI